jgi:hypothetical protein
VLRKVLSDIAVMAVLALSLKGLELLGYPPHYLAAAGLFAGYALSSVIQRHQDHYAWTIQKQELEAKCAALQGRVDLYVGVMRLQLLLQTAKQNMRGDIGFGVAPHWTGFLAGSIAGHNRCVNWVREDGCQVTLDFGESDAVVLAALRERDQDDWARWSSRWDHRTRD